jgi:8-oxo-dGTP diphosphatase
VEADLRARPLAAAGVVVFDDDGHLLIVEPIHKPTWEIPGGMIEHGEAPRAACARALREEVGIEIDVGRLLVVDWMTSRTGEPDGRVEFVFDGGVLTEERLDAIDLPPDELASWACLPVDDLFAMLRADLTRRVTAALGALAAGETWYLESGTRV